MEADRWKGSQCCSAYQSIPLSGSYYFGKDISKTTVKIKVLHNPQHPPLTSEILLHISFYYYFTKALTERQGSKKKKKKSGAGCKEKDDCLCRLWHPLPQSNRGHRGLLRLLFAELGKKK